MKTLVLLIFGIVFNLNLAYSNVVYSNSNEVPVERIIKTKTKKKINNKKLKHLRDPSQQKEDLRWGILIAISIVFLSIALILLIFFIAFAIMGNGGLALVLGIAVAAVSFIGILSLIWGLVIKNRNNDWNKDYQ